MIIFHNSGFVSCNMENVNLNGCKIDQSGIIDSNCKNMTMMNENFIDNVSIS